jgi:hypothetical protein
MMRSFVLGILLVGFGMSSQAVTADGPGSAFTYQGMLSEQGSRANGSYDLQFRLVDAYTNGNYLSSPVIWSAVPVNNGLFTVALNFDTSLYDGSTHWLEIGVRTNGSQSQFALLQPLQPLNSVPQAFFANSAAMAGVASNVVAGAVLTNVVIQGGSIQPGSITAAQIDPATDAAYRNVNTNVVAAIVTGMSTASGSSTPARRLDVKAAFGAIGDGVTDDTAAIQNALNYLGSDSVTNIALYFPPGTYRITQTLTVPPNRYPPGGALAISSGYRLSGGGLSATKLVWSSIGNGIGLAFTDPAGYEGLTMEDLTLVGPLMTTSDPANVSIGLAMGAYDPYDYGWSGFNNTVRNCALMGWGYGAAVTNQWTIVFDNCAVLSNTIEGLRFVGSHGVSVQNCRIGSWNTTCGTGVGFHPPINNGYGDNAQIINCMFDRCTNGIVNNELNLLCLNNHLESCGSYYTLLTAPSLSPSTTIIGGYTLDDPTPWTNVFAGQILMDAGSAAYTVVQNCSFYSYNVTRPVFNVLDDGSGYTMPTFLGGGTLDGLWNTVSHVTLSAPQQASSLTQQPAVSKPVWSYELPLNNGASFTSGITIAQSPAPWSVQGSMEVPNGSVGIVEFAVPHALGFSNFVAELTVQPAPGQTNMAFGLLSQNYSIGPAGPLQYAATSTNFSGVTQGSTSTFYWTNSFGEDLFPRRCRCTITSPTDSSGSVTNDLWLLSWRLFSVETAGN